MDAIVKDADPTQPTRKTIHSMTLKAAAVRDYGASEVHFHNLGLKIVRTNVDIVKICVSDRRRVNTIHEKHRKATNSKKRPAFRNVLRDFYARRVPDFDDFIEKVVNVLADKNFSEENIAELTFYDFSHWFSLKKNTDELDDTMMNDQTIIVRRRKLNSIFILLLNFYLDCGVYNFRQTTVRGGK